MDAKRGKRWQRLRAASQVLFLILFFFLLLHSGRIAVERLPLTGAFFYIDPLNLWVNILAGPFLRPFLLALVPLVLTLLLGRFFCGWVCPFGALLQFFTWLGSKRKREKTIPGHAAMRWKYLLLIVLLVGSLFATQWLGWLDPFSLLTRSSSVTLIPGLNFLLQRALESGAASQSLGGKIVKPLYDFSRAWLLSGEQRTFLLAFAIGAIFFGLLLLNLYRRRFFCNYLCPLGALYGWLAKYSLFHFEVNPDCSKCNACAGHSTYYGGPFRDYQKSECLACMNCLKDCSAAAIDVRWGLPRKGQTPALASPKGTDGAVLPQRRQFLSAIGCGLVAAALPQISADKKKKAHPFIRPPGAAAEKDFVRKCIRCGACMQACPTNAIQPALLQAGIDGLWTPLLVPTSGYCEYECVRCTRVCPTHALANLTLDEKKQFKIGTAVINRSACYTYADGYNCGVCEEHCPVPEKAIKYREVSRQTEESEAGLRGPRPVHRLRHLRKRLPAHRRPGHQGRRRGRAARSRLLNKLN
ncbi:MAG: 4Fe-4S binding protein [Candidatus Aminicenantes bacterium]|nr:4Fe-4S binding protein [Candidatus Aminicenantes bacterium]